MRYKISKNRWIHNFQVMINHTEDNSYHHFTFPPPLTSWQTNQYTYRRTRLATYSTPSGCHLLLHSGVCLFIWATGLSRLGDVQQRQIVTLRQAKNSSSSTTPKFYLTWPTSTLPTGFPDRLRNHGQIFVQPSRKARRLIAGQNFSRLHPPPDNTQQ